MATSTTSRSVPQPVSATAEWASSDPALALRIGTVAGLIITTAAKGGAKVSAYVLRTIANGEQVVGYQLENVDNGEVYDLPADLSSCGCPDHTWRRRPCKHMVGLTDALRQINLL